MRLINKIAIIGFFSFFILVTYGQAPTTKKTQVQYNQFRDYVEWCKKQNKNEIYLKKRSKVIHKKA